MTPEEEKALEILKSTGYIKKHDLEMVMYGMQMCREFLNTSRRSRKWELIGSGLYVCPSCMKAITRHYEWRYCPLCGEDLRGGGE